nr:hypothetical protein [Oceanococcus sp. HetDA_MAG_MS8]
MNSGPIVAVLGALVLAACASRTPSTAPTAGNTQPPPMQGSLAAVPVLTLDAPPARVRQPGSEGEFGYASTISVEVDLAQAGQWTAWDERRQRLRWELSSPQSQNLSLHFSEFHLPPGARLQIYDPSNIRKGMLELGPEANQPHGQYWTPQFAAERIRIDLVLNRQSTGLALRLADINIAY